MRRKILFSAGTLFVQQGYTGASLKSIAADAEVNIGSLMYIYPSKEAILTDLVGYILESQFEFTQSFLEGITYDGVELYAAETTLQLYLVESSETIREMYSSAYSLPGPSDVIQRGITDKLESLFGSYLPGYQTSDYYKLEIASGGIMRGFMTVPCNMWFTIDQKVESFLETSLLIYRVPDEKIKSTISFVKQFDYEELRSRAVEAVFNRMADANTFTNKL